MPSILPLHGFALRAASFDGSAGRVMGVLQASAAAGLPIDRVVIGGVTEALKPTQPAIDALLADSRAQFGGLVFPVGDPALPAIVHVKDDRTDALRRYEAVHFMLPRAQPGLADAGEVLGYFAMLAAAFEASVGGLYHPQHRGVVLRSVLAADTGGVVWPLGAQMPAPPLSSVDAATLERLATPVGPRSYDRSLIPEAVWWANYWSAKVVARLGARRVDAAPWHHVMTLEEAAVYIATALPVRLQDSPGLTRLAELTEALDLYRAQIMACSSE